MQNTTKAFDTVGEFLGNKLGKIKNLLGLIVCITVLNSIGFAAPGFIPDTTFGDLGKVISSPDGSANAAAYGMALQTDGKIIMVGSSGANPGLFVARFNSNGSLDTTFGSNGWTAATVEGGGYAYGVDIQPDGKIVVGGTTRVNNDDYFAIARFNTDGTLDTSFDSDGKKTISFNDIITNGASYRKLLTVIKVGSDGKIIVAGTALQSTVDDRFIFARLESNGAIDTSFGTNGKIVNEPYGSNLDRVTDMVILPDGKFVVSARLTTVCCNFRMAIKFNVNGTREWTYQQGLTEFGNYNGFDGIAALPDGKFIATGNRDGKIVALRLNANGTEDTTFNSSALLPSGQALSPAVQPDGKIVANYMPSNGWADTRNSFNLIRFNVNGTPDSEFGSGGMIPATATAGRDYGQKVFVQPDGKILIGGYSVVNSSYYFSMMRYRSISSITNNPRFDYDGDGRSDISVYRPSSGVWYLNQSTSGFSAAQFGISTDKIVPADYDGDGKTDLAIYRDGVWWILQSSNNLIKTFQFGLAEDKPQTGDFDADGRDDLVVFRPSNGNWYVSRSSDNVFTTTSYGLSQDIPQSADYDGDGKTDIAVFRPSSGVWYVKKSSGGEFTMQFGLNGDRPAASDFDGDGKTDIAVFRPSNGAWYISRSSDNQITILTFGLQEDISVPADYDGDGKADIAVFRPSNGGWYQMLSTSGFSAQVFGLENDRPAPSAFNP